MYILMVGLNHRTASIAIREKLAFSGASLSAAYQQLMRMEDIEGAVILATCNRTEIYANARNIEKGMRALTKFAMDFGYLGPEEFNTYFYKPNCYDTILHLFRVASGLDSMILGESQIIAQVKEAYKIAMEANATNSVLNTLFQTAISVGKRVRTETDIDKHPISASTAAVELARAQLDNLQDKSVVVIGAGEMSELTTRYLLKYNLKSVIVSNRSYQKAVALAELFSGRAVHFDRLTEELAHADIIISCTAARHYVLNTINCSEILKARNGRPVIMIDIAVPRDIDPCLSEIEGVRIYDIDDLQQVVDANYLERKRAASQAERIIGEEMQKFDEWMASLSVVPVVSALKAKGELIKGQEIQKVFNRLDLNDRERKVISVMAGNIINQLLHHPIISLKEMACSNQGHLYAEVTKRLFDLPIELGESNLEGYKIRQQG